jgi:hypothetical protein
VAFSKISVYLFLARFHLQFAQVSKIGFKVFSLGFGKQAVSFGKVRFFWLALFLVKSGL